MSKRSFSFKDEVLVPGTRQEIFAFFSDATNLETLTPSWLSFEVLTPSPIEMATGVRIDYRLKLRRISLRWQSEITRWDPPHSFVDEQRRGPYRQWIHEHRFREQNGKTLIVDHVRYQVMGGWLVNKLFVARDVRAIFKYRKERLQELFGTNPA